jgi:glutathione S-transferase
MHPSPEDAAVLITMPHSHYAEKARWALDYLALPYIERPQLPLFHRFATRPLGGTSVPVLAHGGRAWTDSSAILMWADETAGGDALFPRDAAVRGDVLALEDQFDKVLGPHTRRWGYAQLLGRRDIIANMATRSVPRERARWAPVVMPVFMPLIKRAFDITPETTVRSRDRIDAVFEEVGRRLADGRPYLAGERFSAADLTFAALSAPVLLPPRCPAYPPVSDMPAALRDGVERWRATAAGRFGLAMYERWRWAGRQ